MRMITGAILILAGEQAFAHAHMAPFPHNVFVRDVFLPTSCVLAILGAAMVAWGIVADFRAK